LTTKATSAVAVRRPIPGGLVAQDVGASVVNWKKDGRMPECLQPPGPVMGGTAGLQEDGGGLELCEEWQKPTTGKAMPLSDNTGAVRHGDLENILGNIDSDDCILHSGLLLCFSHINSGTMMPNWVDEIGGVHPIIRTGSLAVTPAASGFQYNRDQRPEPRPRHRACSSTPIRWADRHSIATVPVVRATL